MKSDTPENPKADQSSDINELPCSNAADLPKPNSKCESIFQTAGNLKKVIKPRLDAAVLQCKNLALRIKDWHDNLPDLKRGRLQGATIAGLIIILTVALSSEKRATAPDIAGMIKAAEDAMAERQPAVVASNVKRFNQVAEKAPEPKQLEPRQEYDPSASEEWGALNIASSGLPREGIAAQFRYNPLTFDSDGDTLLAGRSVLRYGPSGYYLEDILEFDDEAFDSSRDWNSNTVCRLSNDTALISVPDLRNGSGVVFVFERKAGNWKQTARLVAPDARPDSKFGSSMEIDGNLLVVGAPRQPLKIKKSNGAASEERVGAAYIFRRKGGQWSFAQKVTMIEPGGWGNRIAEHVAVSNGRIGVSWQQGNQGNIVLGHLDDANNWNQEFLLSENLHGIDGGAPFAIDGDILAVPAENKFDGNGKHSGAEQVYLFQREVGKGDNWRRTASIMAPDYHELDQPLKGFGSYLRMNHKILTVNRGKESSYVFSKSAEGKWTSISGKLNSSGSTPLVVLPQISGMVAVCETNGGRIKIASHAKSDAAFPATVGVKLSRAHCSVLEERADEVTYQRNMKAPFSGAAYELSTVSGKPLLSKNYTDGKLNGTVERFDDRGKLLTSLVYVNGLLKEEKDFEKKKVVSVKKPSSKTTSDRSSFDSILDISRRMGGQDRPINLVPNRSNQDAGEAARRQMQRYQQHLDRVMAPRR